MKLAPWVREVLIRLCFWATLLLGLAIIGLPFAIVQALPSIELDSVLTPEELDDEKLVHETLKRLDKAAGVGGTVLRMEYGLLGLFVAAVGLTGVWLSREQHP